ncbi:Imm63 family immunity protein [Zunongwangia sp. HRR-M8]|uniref:Imm63 family immunity protein n=1 Tax=Zunongwangia sp. HRR-M8 TaxID=3015170 RepID=UPI0022DE9103|nr:Imm63 family immunity protein [Zunongwangia sp. HRR-M8]WBL23854.1 Imm63 family immunity protein [Zunongwangia sp. HRR-M8]
MTKTVTEIEKVVKQLAKKINSPRYLLPTFSSPIGDATPNIEVDNVGLYNYVISERGNEYERKLTSDLNELLYWIFSPVTFSMACDYELKNRIEEKDCRRIIFEKQEKLLGILDKKWEEKERKEHQSILVNNPFDDLASLRAKYCRELRTKGLSETKIEKLAYEKYPE